MLFPQSDVPCINGEISIIFTTNHKRIVLLKHIYKLNVPIKRFDGGLRSIILETLILRYELEGKARTHPKILRVVLVPCAQFTQVRPRSKNGP